MDIQVSSNFERLLYDFYNEGKIIKKIFLELESTGKFKIPKDKLEKIKLILNQENLMIHKLSKQLNFLKKSMI